VRVSWALVARRALFCFGKLLARAYLLSYLIDYKHYRCNLPLRSQHGLQNEVKLKLLAAPGALKLNELLFDHVKEYSCAAAWPVARGSPDCE